MTIHETNQLSTVLSATNAPALTGADVASVHKPLYLGILCSDTGLTVNLSHEDGGPIDASILIEIGSDGHTPVLRVWDGEQGVDDEPVYLRQMVLDAEASQPPYPHSEAEFRYRL